LGVQEHGHKGDKKGSHKFHKSVYANPTPAICAILALAVLLFSCSNRDDAGRQQLFSGTDSKGIFANILHETVFGLDVQQITRLGCQPPDIATHSNRKGSATYVLGQVMGPNPITVFLRMGQSLGQLKDR
jgi:hypothetical protein